MFSIRPGGRRRVVMEQEVRQASPPLNSQNYQREFAYLRFAISNYPTSVPARDTVTVHGQCRVILSESVSCLWKSAL